MKSTSTRLAILAAATLFALPACSDRGNPTAPSAPATAPTNARQNGGASITKAVTGTFTNAAGLGSVTGTFTLQQFIVRNGELFAVGSLTATLTDALGNELGTVTQQVTMPVSAVSGSCQILHLELGPLDLDLLGLQVHLDRVVLDITAQSGPGNLLGNLLCAIANLLNGGLNLSILNQLAGLLNQVIALL